ncbi:hypothetical protein M1349_03495 [Patescibacteria group bacterium]|nr:hypothetical protein [Patescibacteria group bacterium]
MKTKIFLSIFFLTLFLQVPKDKAFAACAGVPLSGNYTVTTSCAFQNTVDGVDAGTGASNSAVLTIGSGKTLTINAGQKVAFGLMSVGKPGGTIAINKTGELVKKPLWAPNEDGDVRPTTANPDLLAQSAQPANHSRRNVLNSLSTADCLDTDAAKWQNLDGYTDSDSDGYGVGVANAIGNRGTPGGVAGAGGASMTLNKPAGTVSGDVIIAFIQTSGTTTVTPPADWKPIETIQNTGSTNVFFKVAGGSEPASYTFNYDASPTYHIGRLVTYYNVDGSDPADVIHSGVTDSTSPFTASAITTIFPESKLIAVMGIYGNRTWSGWTAGFTELIDNGTTNAGFGVAEATQSAVASTGAVSATPSVEAAGAAILFALRPTVAQTPSSICSGSSLPSGYANNGTDCLPADAAKYQRLTCYTDPTTFSYTGGSQSYTVPTGATAVKIVADGAAGGGGGLGGRAQGIISSTPGETLNVYVGGAGASCSGTGCRTRGAGGWNGGAAGGTNSSDQNAQAGSGGGGASDVRQGGTLLSNRKIVGGGGGGKCGTSAWYSSCGNTAPGGGNPNGLPTDGAGSLCGDPFGGSQTAAGGGACDAGVSGRTPGGAGSSATGGTGANSSGLLGGGGGGGGAGGYYGGGGGASGGDNGSQSYAGTYGAGGSSWVTGSASNVSYTNGSRSGNGQIIIYAPVSQCVAAACP